MNKEAKLNKSQRKAVSKIEGPCLVIAGPGSGKTRVIAHRIANMVVNENIPSTRILAISFTKASAVDMKRRTTGLLNDDRLKKVSFATFHSAFFRIIKRYMGVSIEDLISESDRFKLMKAILRHLKISNISDDDISDILGEVSFVKNDLIDFREYSSEHLGKDEFQKAFELYESEKKRLSKIDFDDMLIMTYDLLMKNDEVLEIVRQVYRYILIDEFQDINRVQFETIRLIAYPKNNVFAVGDEDQSIYGFRGARPDFMMDFDKYFKGCEKIVLDTNYRSKKNIVEMSQKLISNNVDRYEKSIMPFSNQDGEIKFISPIDYDEEAEIVSKEILMLMEKENLEYDDFAVVYRNNSQARAFVDVFMEKRIPFVLKDNIRTIFDHWASLDILAYLRAALEIASADEWLRIINKPYRYISKEAIRNALKSDKFLDSLIEDENVKPFTKRTLRDLEEDLRYIKGLEPEYAISYIRSTLDYDRYILEYCHERKIQSAQIVDILDELESSSKQFRTTLEFFSHITEFKEEVKKNAEKAKISQSEEHGVVLSTMHSSKGLEFRTVFAVGINKGVIPYKQENLTEDDHKNSKSQNKNLDDLKLENKGSTDLNNSSAGAQDSMRSSMDDSVSRRDENSEIANDTTNLEEERRLMYVAVTRAMDRVIISSPLNRHKKKMDRSIFVDELS